MRDIARKWWRRVGRIRPLRDIVTRAKFPGISIAPGANLDIAGDFRYGTGCAIGEGANILVPKGASLMLGDGCHIGRYAEIGPGDAVSIGSYTSIQDRCVVVGDVSLGRYCLLSLNVLLSSGRHYFDLDPPMLITDQDSRVRADAQLSAQHNRPVRIEDDCWVGINTVVMPGVTVGKGAVVGAGSIVVRDVAPYTVVAGSPANEIRKRLDFAPPKRITYDSPEHLPYFYSGFEVSQSALQQYAAHGGVASRQAFEIRLDFSSARNVCLVAKCVGVERCTVDAGSQQRGLTNEFQRIEFDVPALGSGAPAFRAAITPSEAIVVVKEAWAQ